MSQPLSKSVKIAILVAALGYFVDVFDLILFSLVRVSSLTDLGLSGDDLLNEGIFLINCQMTGMLIGGVLFGVWGDKKGRLSVLFASILMYSVANILNAFVYDVPSYAVLRFIAGIGLAGELGAGITLVAECMPKEKRGLGTTVVATVGVLGAVVASIVTRYMDWRWAYGIAGGLGLGLLALRVAVNESGLFEKLCTHEKIIKGDLRLIFQKSERFKRFVFSILPGLPIWFILGVLVTLAPEIGTAKGLDFVLSAADAVFYVYIGFTLGDLGSGLISQKLKSRKKVIYGFIAGAFVFSLIMLLTPSLPKWNYHILYLVLGFFGGYWAVFITMAAEQFGTNLRATVATSVPNFIRGSVPPMTLSLQYLTPKVGIIYAATIVLATVSLISWISLSFVEDTFTKDLDFYET